MISQILKAAKARLTPETWGQGDGGQSCLSMPDGRLCTAMAIAWRQDSTHEERHVAIELLAKTITGASEYNSDLIPCWNDAPERTLADVHAAYDAAIAIAEQQEAVQSGEPVEQPVGA